MSRVNEILEQIMLEDADAVLYSVMRSFLKRKSKEYNCCADDIYLTAEFNKINIYKETEQCGLEFVESERV